MARITLHFCLRHNLMFGGYRRHMDEDHGGRSDCVLGLTSAQALRILHGESVSDVCFKRDTSICRHCTGPLAVVPADRTTATWHEGARCIEGDEPSYRMGGPA